MRTERSARDAWYGQPVVWLAMTVCGIVLAGSIATIVLGVRHADTPLPEVSGQKILKVPLAHAAIGPETETTDTPPPP